MECQGRVLTVKEKSNIAIGSVIRSSYWFSHMPQLGCRPTDAGVGGIAQIAIANSGKGAAGMATLPGLSVLVIKKCTTTLLENAIDAYHKGHCTID